MLRAPFHCSFSLDSSALKVQVAVPLDASSGSKVQTAGPLGTLAELKVHVAGPLTSAGWKLNVHVAGPSSDSSSVSSSESKVQTANPWPSSESSDSLLASNVHCAGPLGRTSLESNVACPLKVFSKLNMHVVSSKWYSESKVQSATPLGTFGNSKVQVAGPLEVSSASNVQTAGSLGLSVELKVQVAGPWCVSVKLKVHVADPFDASSGSNVHTAGALGAYAATT